MADTDRSIYSEFDECIYLNIQHSKSLPDSLLCDDLGIRFRVYFSVTHYLIEA